MNRFNYKEVPLKTRIGTGLIWFAMGLVSVALCVILYWSVTGRDALTIKTDPFVVSPPVTRAQEVISMDISVCKHTNADGVVFRHLVSDRTELAIPSTNDGLPKGCYEFNGEQALKIPIPPQTPPGKYRVRYRVIYKTNPLHTITEVFYSQEFTVL